jgi:hypothetical protein
MRSFCAALDEVVVVLSGTPNLARAKQVQRETAEPFRRVAIAVPLPESAIVRAVWFLR